MVRPFYKDNDITLYNCSCDEFVVDHDLLLTDPPYGSSYESRFGGEKRTHQWGLIKNDNDMDHVHELLRFAIKGLRKARHAYVFGKDVDMLKLGLFEPIELIWDKGVIGVGGLSRPWGPAHEYIQFATNYAGHDNKVERGKLAARLRKGTVLRVSAPRGVGAKNHPTEKPLKLLRELIESSSRLDEVVYDPFAGSGSTLIAAAMEGRKAVGCELEERYCKTAVKRFKEELSSWR
jgi:DNA modification methylase